MDQKQIERISRAKSWEAKNIKIKNKYTGHMGGGVVGVDEVTQVCKKVTVSKIN